MSARRPMLSPPQALFDAARNGRIAMLIDDETPDGTGAFVLPAQLVTPDAVNFMASHGRGLVCLALTKARADRLRLRPLNPGRDGQAGFTASIEARDGVSTGISAADRARTIAVAVEAGASDDLVTPGHVFPVIARDGGVLVRAGHAEAAVDLARLAGLNASGVVCEIMNDDGEMARLDDLVALGERHGLVMGTIRDLIAYRRRHDHLVEKTAEARFHSAWGGTWCAKAYRNSATGGEQIALVHGTIDPAAPVLVRMHALSPFADLFGDAAAQGSVLARSMAMIHRAGAGVVVLIGGAHGSALTEAVRERAGGTTAAPIDHVREYGVGAMILVELGVRRMTLLTNTPRVLVGLDGYGLAVVGTRALTDDPFAPTTSAPPVLEGAAR